MFIQRIDIYAYVWYICIIVKLNGHWRFIFCYYYSFYGGTFMKLKKIAAMLLCLLTFSACMTGCADEENPPEQDEPEIQYGEDDVAKLAVYTKESSEGYSSYIAESVHMAVSFDGKTYEPLFYDYGMLFSECEFSDLDGIISTGILDPQIYLDGDEYVIYAKEYSREKIDLGDYGTEIELNDTGKYVVWRTSDFLEFTMPEVADSAPGEGTGVACTTDVDGAVSPVEIDIPALLAADAVEYYAHIEFDHVEYPEEITVSSEEDLDDLYATVYYTDGSTHDKKIILDTSKIDFSKPGEYTVDGTIFRRSFPFPVESRPWGDPNIILYEGRYYFIGTDDQNGQNEFEIREADTPEALFEDGVKRSTILSYKNEIWQSTYWAPELHEINGKLYIFCAMTISGWDPQAYVIELKDGGDPLNPDDWEDPRRCVLPDMRYAGDNPRGDGKGGISIDMTYFEAGGESYVAWSYRTYAGTDSGSMILLATVDPDMPYIITSEPILLTRPRFGWENVDVTDNNEGPNAIVTEDKVYLSYSAGSAGGDTYAVGMLIADIGDDLMDPNSWTKSQTPWLASNFVEGQYGPGHNSFFVDEYGDTYIAYHGHTSLTDGARVDGIRRVHFSADGSPVLDMTAEQDLPTEEQAVTITVIVE